MNLTITTEYNGQMPEVQLPGPSLLNAVGEEGIRNMISNHYDLLVKSKIAHMFPPNPEALEMAKKRSADFFIQIQEGHPHYRENRGNPMLRKRHMPFPIDMDARVEWLRCYQEVIVELGVSEDVVKPFWNYLNKFSLWMMNK